MDFLVPTMDRRYSTITELEAEQRLQQRLKELERLKQIKSLTENLSTSLENFNTQMKRIDHGSVTVGEVTANWVQIVRAISLAANSIMIYKDEDFQLSSPTTERLVRCKIDHQGRIEESEEDM